MEREAKGYCEKERQKYCYQRLAAPFDSSCEAQTKKEVPSAAADGRSREKIKGPFAKLEKFIARQIRSNNGIECFLVDIHCATK